LRQARRVAPAGGELRSTARHRRRRRRQCLGRRYQQPNPKIPSAGVVTLAGQRRESKKKAPARRGYDRVLLDGIVEAAENGERRSSSGIEELWGVLSRPPQAGKRNA
jgi:hypothetical protein